MWEAKEKECIDHSAMNEDRYMSLADVEEIIEEELEEEEGKT